MEEPKEHETEPGTLAELLVEAWRRFPPAPDLGPLSARCKSREDVAELVRADALERFRAREPIRLSFYKEVFPGEDFSPGSSLGRLVFGLLRVAGAKPDELLLEVGEDYARDLALIFFANEPTPRDLPGEQVRREPAMASPHTTGVIRPGLRVGQFVIKSFIGGGGFGEVWLAHRENPFLRAAIKVLKSQHMDRSSLARFEAEAQALAFLEHECVARIYETGTIDGAPFIAMEYVGGLPLDEYCDHRKLSIEARLELMARVCEGVQHAHLKGLVHRDLSPDNILVTEVIKDDMELSARDRACLVVDRREGRPVVPVAKIVDFGLAKATDPSVRLSKTTLSLDIGKMIGKPRFMAPEQATHRPLEVDQRADIFSLGVIVYLLLAGVLPLGPETLRDHTIDELVAAVRDTNRPEPLAAFSKLDRAHSKQIAAARGGLTPERLAVLLDRRIRHVVGKALRLEPGKRFSSAAAMARDIRHFLDDRDYVEAAAEPWRDRARRAIRRNRLAFGSGLVIAACLVAATAISLRFAMVAEKSRDEAERTTLYLTQEVFGNLGETIPTEPGARGMDVSVRRVLDVARKGPSLLALDPRVKPRVLGAIGQAYLKLGVFDEARSALLDALGSGTISDPTLVESLKSDLQDIEMRTGPSDAEVLRKAQAHYENCLRAFGRDDAKTIDALNLLAGALKNSALSTERAELARQRLDQAESYYADVLQGRGSAGNTLDCFIVEHNMNLVALVRARRIRDSHPGESSEPLFEAVLGPRRTLTRRMERDLGPEHWQTLASRAEELTLLMLAGHNDEALQAYPALVREMRSQLGFLNWRTVDATAQWARSLKVTKRYREAGFTYLLAFETSIMTRPPWHADSRNCLLGLVGCSELAGDYESALLALRRGLKASFDARASVMTDENRRLCERYQRDLASRMLAMFQ